ncbi:hypothetical protein BO70DRAFT_398295 [Aspergillus heteromorphus CBS 117.55]|uniref:Uncharacterized protein n=1 Tax=Aspergillus heteromorphus CBS 117.55 TaxID=1448321 RepID=A0A317VP95_9EURO|nr:uncharacterized protein BO70DRAFT_398295 [Aspergillus heteromorphus CBS 117.55]PWY75439.1 hypothetical protein BO70DRAFT_398295 [Aspergillus heteromorphus CBS 117.55]
MSAISHPLIWFPWMGTVIAHADPPSATARPTVWDPPPLQPPTPEVLWREFEAASSPRFIQGWDVTVSLLSPDHSLRHVDRSGTSLVKDGQGRGVGGAPIEASRVPRDAYRRLSVLASQLTGPPAPGYGDGVGDSDGNWCPPGVSISMQPRFRISGSGPIIDHRILMGSNSWLYADAHSYF